jgi:hypothetical protein
MGQCSEDMVRAERALRELRGVLEVEKTLQVDLLNAEMPGVLLAAEKTHRMWGEHFLSQLMPPDFMELCQIAATQENRCKLFEDPFH